MERIAKFEKVTLEQFSRDAVDFLAGSDASVAYSNIILPRRATAGSAGYDFFAPAGISLVPGAEVTIPTGIRVRMEEGWVLQCYPRSGLGFKYRLQMNNTVGIIDSDYYFSDNEGHILARFTNGSLKNQTLSLAAGQAFMQGVFMRFGITYEDDVKTARNGGFGSTNKSAG